MKIQNKKILCFGEVLWDMLPSGEKPGGAPMNVALHLKKFGFDVSLASKVGKDDPGKKLLSFISNSGLEINNVQQDDKLETSTVLVHIDGQEARYEICEPVAWDNIKITQELKEEVKSCGVIVYGSLASRNAHTKHTLQSILNKDLLRIMDVNLRPPYDRKALVVPLLKLADVIKLNEEEIVQIASWFDVQDDTTEVLMRWLAKEFNAMAVCVTRGEDGAYLLHDDLFYSHQGFKVDAQDPVGAGDAFLAGYIYSLLSDKTAEDSIEFACATGALVASKAGAAPEYGSNEILNIANSKN